MYGLNKMYGWRARIKWEVRGGRLKKSSDSD